jgi:hypothetical protein
MRILLFLLLFVGCAVNNVKYRMPANRFNTPEVTGGSLFTLDVKGRANVNYGASNKVSTSDVIANAIGAESADTIIEDSSQLGARLDLSILDRLDFYWNYTLFSPTTLGFKWQFLGKTEEAFSAGWKSSLTAGFGSSTTGQRLMPIEDTGTTTLTAGKNDTDVYDTYWMIGYRFPERILVYLNINYTLYKNELTYKEQSSTQQVKTFDSDNWGAILGLEYYFKSKSSFLLLELGYSEGQVENVSSNNMLSAGINFGWRFD